MQKARASLLANEKFKGVKLTFTSNEIIVNASNPNGDEIVDSTECEYAGDEVTIGFNSTYLSASVNALTGSHASMGIGSDNSPAKITDPSDGSVIHVVMPYRI